MAEGPNNQLGRAFQRLSAAVRPGTSEQGGSEGSGQHEVQNVRAAFLGAAMLALAGCGGEVAMPAAGYNNGPDQAPLQGRVEPAYSQDGRGVGASVGNPFAEDLSLGFKGADGKPLNLETDNGQIVTSFTIAPGEQAVGGAFIGAGASPECVQTTATYNGESLKITPNPTSPDDLYGAPVQINPDAIGGQISEECKRLFAELNK